MPGSEVAKASYDHANDDAEDHKAKPSARLWGQSLLSLVR